MKKIMFCPSGVVFFQCCFLVGLGVEQIQETTPPRQKLDSKKQQYNTWPNDTHFQKTSESISISNSTLSASLRPDRHIVKWGAGAAPPEVVFNKNPSSARAACRIAYTRHDELCTCCPVEKDDSSSNWESFRFVQVFCCVDRPLPKR